MRAYTGEEEGIWQRNRRLVATENLSKLTADQLQQLVDKLEILESKRPCSNYRLLQWMSDNLMSEQHNIASLRKIIGILPSLEMGKHTKKGKANAIYSEVTKDGHGGLCDLDDTWKWIQKLQKRTKDISLPVIGSVVEKQNREATGVSASAVPVMGTVVAPERAQPKTLVEKIQDAIKALEVPTTWGKVEREQKKTVLKASLTLLKMNHDPKAIDTYAKALMDNPSYTHTWIPRKTSETEKLVNEVKCACPAVQSALDCLKLSALAVPRNALPAVQSQEVTNDDDAVVRRVSCGV